MTVVTGIGLVTPLGRTRQTTWDGLMGGVSSIRSGPDGLEAAVQGVSPNGAHSRAGDFAVLAAEEALNQAGLDASQQRIGCAIGQSKPILWEQPNELNPMLLIASFTGWSLESVVKSHFRLDGPSSNVAAACATGVAAIETALSWIENGSCDAVLAGAAESSLFPFYRSGFSKMGVLAEGMDRSDVKPFDKNRHGFALGEGAAVLVLESEASCRKRNVRPLAKISGIALRQSAVDPLRFDETGAQVESLMKAVMGSHPVPSYINAHGTGTKMNDLAEARGISQYLVGSSGTVVGSTKASTGHLLGAAGAVEAAFSVLSVVNKKIPPSLHIQNPDPECRFPLAGSQSQSANVESALSLSYGFGGQMGGVLFSQP